MCGPAASPGRLRVMGRRIPNGCLRTARTTAAADRLMAVTVSALVGEPVRSRVTVRVRMATTDRMPGTDRPPGRLRICCARTGRLKRSRGHWDLVLLRRFGRVPPIRRPPIRRPQSADCRPPAAGPPAARPPAPELPASGLPAAAPRAAAPRADVRRADVPLASVPPTAAPLRPLPEPGAPRTEGGRRPDPDRYRDEEAYRGRPDARFAGNGRPPAGEAAWLSRSQQDIRERAGSRAGPSRAGANVPVPPVPAQPPGRGILAGSRGRNEPRSRSL